MPDIPAEAVPEDSCRVVEVPDVGPIQVRGGEMDDTDLRYFADVVQAAKRRYIAEHGDPDE